LTKRILRSSFNKLIFRKIFLVSIISLCVTFHSGALGFRLSEGFSSTTESLFGNGYNFTHNAIGLLTGNLTSDAIIEDASESNGLDDLSFSEILTGQIDWRTIAFKFFFAGTLVIMFLYHLGLNFYSSKDRTSLIFSILLLFMAIRIMFTGHDILMLIFPDATWGGYYKLRFITTYFAPVFFILYLRSLFKEESKGLPLNILLGVSLVAGVFVVFAHPLIVLKTLKVFNVFLVVVASILVFITFKAFLKKEKGGVLILTGHLVFYFFLLYDLAFSMQMFESFEIFTIGLLVFILLQSYAISVRFWNFYLKLRDPEVVIEQRNKNLEQILKDRSEDLVNQKNLLEEINRELQDQKEDMLTQSEMMDDLNQLLEQEKQKSDGLLLNILPRNIAQELKLYGKAPTYAFPNVSVLFVDFVGFSESVEKVDAQTLVDELHNYFANFDDVIKKYNLEKIKTIGDAYMCAGGLRQESGAEDAQATVYAALELSEFMEAYREERMALDEFCFNFRIGIHTGPVIAGVVGKSKFAFDIWGQTVNIAKETESASKPGKINISEVTYELVKDHFRCIPRGEVIIKHNRGVQMYFVEGKI
jgi:class 3 adenylate cyclase